MLLWHLLQLPDPSPSNSLASPWRHAEHRCRSSIYPRPGRDSCWAPVPEVVAARRRRPRSLMSAEQLRYRAGIQRLVQLTSSAPPDMPIGTPPLRPAGLLTIVLKRAKPPKLHGLAALRTVRGGVGHVAHPNGATSSSRSNSATQGYAVVRRCAWASSRN